MMKNKYLFEKMYWLFNKLYYLFIVGTLTWAFYSLLKDKDKPAEPTVVKTLEIVVIDSMPYWERSRDSFEALWSQFSQNKRDGVINDKWYEGEEAYLWKLDSLDKLIYNNKNKTNG